MYACDHVRMCVCGSMCHPGRARPCLRLGTHRWTRCVWVGGWAGGVCDRVHVCVCDAHWPHPGDLWLEMVPLEVEGWVFVCVCVCVCSCLCVCVCVVVCVCVCSCLFVCVCVCV